MLHPQTFLLLDKLYIQIPLVHTFYLFQQQTQWPSPLEGRVVWGWQWAAAQEDQDPWNPAASWTSWTAQGICYNNKKKIPENKSVTGEGVSHTKYSQTGIDLVNGTTNLMSKDRK